MTDGNAAIHCSRVDGNNDFGTVVLTISLFLVSLNDTTDDTDDDTAVDDVDDNDTTEETTGDADAVGD